MSNGFVWCDFLAGWAGGIFGLVVGHPLDTIKVRQQIIGSEKIIPLIISTYKGEGLFAFYKGLSYPLLGSGIYNALFFGVYGNCLRYLQGISGTHLRKMCCEGDPPNSKWHRDVFIAGCIGGIAAVLYSCPLEIVKIKLQSQTVSIPSKPVPICKKMCKTEPVYTGSLNAFVTIYKKYGLCKGLYRGTWILFWRDVPTYGLYTLAYEHVLCLFKRKDDRSSNTSLTSQIVAGGTAGFLSWVVVAPLDVIKSRIQGDDFGRSAYKGITDCFRKIVHEGGKRALFLGTTLAGIRAIPVNAATFVGYEFTMNLCQMKDSKVKAK